MPSSALSSIPPPPNSTTTTTTTPPVTLPLTSPSSGGITYSNASNALIICVECGHPVAYIYKEYSPGNIRLTRCRKCRQIADKYIEYESILLFIDMLLHRIGVYRHMLFNYPAHIDYRPKQHKIIPSTWKILFMLLCIDSYTKLYRLRADETTIVINPSSSSATATTSTPGPASSSSVTSSFPSSSSSTLSSSSSTDTSVITNKEDYIPCSMDNSSSLLYYNTDIEVTIDDTCLGAGVLGYEINLLQQHESYERLMRVRELREKALRKAALEATENSKDWALNWKTGNILVTGKTLPSNSSEDITSTAYAYLQAAKEWGVQQVQRLSTTTNLPSSGTGNNEEGRENTVHESSDPSFVSDDNAKAMNLTSILNPNGTLPLCTNQYPRIIATSPRTRRVVCGICGDTGPDILSSEWSNNQTNSLITSTNPTIQTFHWNIQDLQYEGPKILFMTSFEWLMYLFGIILVLRFGNILARSRARIDCTTGSPRIPPPRSRRSLIHMESSLASSSSNTASTAVRSNSGTSSLPPLPPSTTSTPSLSSFTANGQGILNNTNSARLNVQGKISTEQDKFISSADPTTDSMRITKTINDTTNKFNLPPLELSVVRELSETSQRSDYSSDTNTSSSNGNLNSTGSHPSQTATLPSPSTSGGSPHGSDHEQTTNSTTSSNDEKNERNHQRSDNSTVSPPISNTSTAPAVSNASLSSFTSSKPLTSSNSTSTNVRPGGTYGSINSSKTVVSSSTSKTVTLSWIETYFPIWSSPRPIIDPSPPTWQEMKGIANTLIISSFGRAFVAVTTVWVYPSSFYHAATCFAITSNMAALQAYCDCSLIEGFSMVFVGYSLLLTLRALFFTLGYLETFSIF